MDRNVYVKYWWNQDIDKMNEDLIMDKTGGKYSCCAFPRKSNYVGDKKSARRPVIQNERY